MKQHFFMRLCSLLLIFCFCFMLFACQDKETSELEALYQKYVAAAEADGKTLYGYDEWLDRLASDKLTGVQGGEHIVTFLPKNGEEAFSQTVVHGEKVAFPDAPQRLGYAFIGWAIENEDQTDFWSPYYSVTSDITLCAQWEYFSEELPIINIDTQGAAIDSKVTYTEMTFSLENCDGELSEITGGIRLRGNSTMHYPKKPYRIKFDKK